MSEAPEVVREKLSEFFRWEKRRRREQILLSVAGYALVAALLLLPIYFLLPHSFLRWLIPLSLFVLFAPFVFYRGRWRRQDSARALVRLDRALHSDERAITAWELMEANEHRPAALLVVRQAAERLKMVDPKALFRRRWRWQDHALVPLLLLWTGLVWFEVDLRLGPDIPIPVPQALAYKLREFSRELQEKAGNEGLRESLQIGRELEQAAQKGIEAKTADEQFKSELSGMSSRVGALGKSAGKEPSFATAESRQSLKDLKAELQAAQELLNFPDGAKTESEIGQRWLDRLSTLPQLKRQFDQQGQASPSLSQHELKSVLDTMNQQVTGELDRRTLLDAQEFLEQLAKQGQGQKPETDLRIAGRGEQDPAGDGEKTKSNSDRPGSEPGAKEETVGPAPQSPGGAPTQLKGMLGEGDSSGVVLKGKPSAGKTQVFQEEVIATYRRQLEQELNTERVPEALKETIRKYFLSLENNQEQR